MLIVRDRSLPVLFWPPRQSCQACEQRRQYAKSVSVWRRATKGEGATDPRAGRKKVLKPPAGIAHHAGLEDHISAFRCSSVTGFTLLQSQRNNNKSEASASCPCSWEPCFSLKEITQVHF